VGNLDYLEASGLINFEKILLVYEVLSDVKRWQRECKDFKIKLPDKVPSSPIATCTRTRAHHTDRSNCHSCRSLYRSTERR
jgi:hypothetical protein